MIEYKDTSFGGFTMKKILLILLFSFLLPLSIFAAPFGLKMGMTIEQIADECEEEPQHVKDDIYMVIPKKRHPVFEYYAVYVNEKTGLYQIRAISEPISTNKYGTDLQNAFNNVKDRIAKTYGKPKIYDSVDKSISSFLQNDDYWFYTLREGSRELSAAWGKNTQLADNLETVALECVFVDGFYDGTGQLILYYYFNNYDSVEDDQDSVF